MGAKLFKATVQPFEQKLNVIVAKSMKEGMKFFNDNPIGKNRIVYEDKDKTAGGLFYRDLDGNCYIFLKYNSDIHDIVHESFHAIMGIAKDRGAKHNQGSEEFYAYSLGQLSQNIMNFFYSLKKVRKLNKVDGRKK